ncbi:AMP-binding protein [Desertibacillus haloalkaliphilus]|uniref:AMP-binding protein n=1 Tax=Desertibacillus haloalkaliphilus TaxID=1328930 RepID=UPI001C254D82|nr:AMP-binding protein [Desertibacillus haloalkaliphilus]MBU8906235.1 AMP-binding protein [Desertibacillus haloalkaliphilus]
MYRGEKTFGKIVEYRAKQKPAERFIRFENEDLTYQEYHSNGNKFANVIARIGLSKGDSCAVMLANSSEFLTSWLGLARLGVIEVPINTSLRGDVLAYILNKAKCKALVISDQWADRINALADELQYLRHVIVVGNDGLTVADRFRGYSYEALMEEASDTPVDVEIQPQDTSLILFTSGTTGPSKGVILSHNANFSLAKTACDLMDYRPEDRLYTVFPLFHINARYTTILTALMADCDVVMHQKFSASRFWEICRSENITSFNFMGSMLTILMKQPERPNDANNPVRKAYGAPTPVEIYDDFRKRFQVEISEVYGSTELGTAIYNRADSFRLGSCGKPVPIYEVEIHDENDQPCRPGKAGEIVVRPKEPGIMFSGYYGMPDKTVEAWQNLWFHTGDRGRMDEDGYFYFLDRQKDAVRRKGENISSYEVERVINEHPKVKESAVIGVPSELSEEEVMAIITLKDGVNLNEVELLDFCQTRMADFAIPRYIRYMEQLPKNTSLRVEKYKLRKEGVTQDTWDREQEGYKVRG